MLDDLRCVASSSVSMCNTLDRAVSAVAEDMAGSKVCKVDFGTRHDDVAWCDTFVTNAPRVNESEGVHRTYRTFVTQV